MFALGIIVYFVIGSCAAAYRAYLDPVIMEREGWTYATRSLFYGESVCFHLILWPIALPITVALVAADVFRERGVRARAEEKARELQAERDAAEIERIIAEAKL